MDPLHAAALAESVSADYKLNRAWFDVLPITEQSTRNL
jgi:hypothetical protein